MLQWGNETMAKMIFINYCPDDQLSGCMILSYKAELTYRRLQDLIYTNDDNLFDDAIIWDLATRGYTEEAPAIKEELIKKGKITIEQDKIRNKRCSAEIQAAKDRHDKSKKAAAARWGNANASSEHMLEPSQPQTTNYKPLTTNNKNIYTQEFDIFWKKYVLDEGDKRSTKFDTFKQWKRLSEEDRSTLGDKFLAYKSIHGEFFKALERFISKKIYLDVTAEKPMSKEEFAEWQWNMDIDMRKKGLKTMRWSEDYIRRLDKHIEMNK